MDLTKLYCDNKSQYPIMLFSTIQQNTMKWTDIFSRKSWTVVWFVLHMYIPPQGQHADILSKGLERCKIIQLFNWMLVYVYLSLPYSFLISSPVFD